MVGHPTLEVRRGRWLVFALLAFALVSSSSSAARAQNVEYTRTIRAALEEFDAGNFPEARAAFTRAHQLHPNARTYRGLGFVAFELRNYVECADYLEAALKSSERPLQGEARSSTEALLERARGLIGRVHLSLVPKSASVLLDGVPKELPPNTTLLLGVGDHRLELRADGYLSEQRELKIAGGEQLMLDVQLRPERTSASLPVLPSAPVPAPRDEAPVRRPVYKNPWLWVAVGVVLAGAGVGAAFLLRPEAKVTRGDAVTTDNTPPGGVVQALGSF